MNLSGGNILVLGAGRTGRSVARFLRQRGATVLVAERSAAARTALESAPGVSTVPDTGADLLRDVDLVVPSPGIARSHPVLVEAVSRCVPVWSEIELASRFLPCPMLAVTGTNGKSTTTALLGAMAVEAGLRTFVGGGLGTPLIDVLRRETMPELVVVEVSSFQLEWIDAFHPRLGVFLNIAPANLAPAHLERYGSIDEYRETKAALIEALGPGDFAILNRDDDWVWGLRERTAASTTSFGRDAVEFGSYLDREVLVVWGTNPEPRRFSVRPGGTHNEEYLLAAVTAACAWDLPGDAIQRALDATEPSSHREALQL